MNTKQTKYYDNDKQSTIYYFKPGTPNIYLFNNDKQEF